MSKSVAIMPGDGGAEALQPAVAVLDAVGDFEFREGVRAGGEAIDYCGDPVPRITRRVARASHATLLGSVGGEQWESDDPRAPVPETALRTLHRTINAHAFVQPVVAFEGLAESSPVKAERLTGVDLVIVHGLGDVFDGPKGSSGDLVYDRAEYTPEQIKKVGRTAFEEARARAAEGRTAQVTIVDKSNVTSTSVLLRDTLMAQQAEEYPDVEVDHLLADNAQMQVVDAPARFGVIVAGNLFGNMLAGAAAGITDPRLVPSALLNDIGQGIYRPARPEGLGKSVPVILSAAQALRYSLDMPEAALQVENAVGAAMSEGAVPADLDGEATVGEFTEIVIDRLGVAAKRAA